MTQCMCSARHVNRAVTAEGSRQLYIATHVFFVVFCNSLDGLLSACRVTSAPLGGYYRLPAQAVSVERGGSE
jgi:hypothetical protein